MKQFNPYNHFGFLTNRVARLIVKHAELHMIDVSGNVPASCIGIMAELWSKDGISQKELGVSLIKNKSSVNKMLVSLEDAGMIIKKDNPEDKRGKLIFITQKGRELQNYVERKSNEMEEEILKDCTKEEIKITKKVLAELYEKLRSHDHAQCEKSNSII